MKQINTPFVFDLFHKVSVLFQWRNWGKLRRRATYEVLTSNGSSSSSVTRRFITIHAFIHADHNYAIITIHGVHTCMHAGILSLDIWPCIFMVVLGSNKKVTFYITRFPVAIKGLPWEIWLLLPPSKSSGAASTATIPGWNIFSPLYQEQQADCAEHWWQRRN